MENEELEKKIKELEKKVQFNYSLVMVLGIFTLIRIVTDIIIAFMKAYFK
ncbi:hypothetical protein [Dysgonomonas termitidis]|uniref:Uncharacterized protein n=1 Tax=Dysgonomonas termitidis TaxID=1516126 RepID=A0ABV9KUA0_9BACT